MDEDWHGCEGDKIGEIKGNLKLMMEKGNTSGKEMAKVTTGFEHVTTMPKFKRRNVSAVRDFLPGCGRGLQQTSDYIGKS
ncbi:hypothetical protein J1N35_013949 [Gossypium stocksii]|uniref:Uncharacterized protein n=1 Tax=Gossypium stocksii TaxID=47602 RepID=A0A9D3VUK4_9ROSI|nr:hypothetical protein J1N35_013949 [Gossypium stocksii]